MLTAPTMLFVPLQSGSARRSQARARNCARCTRQGTLSGVGESCLESRACWETASAAWVLTAKEAIICEVAHG
jgi:hypothetical protein